MIMPSVEGVRISELPQATTADGSDVLAGVQYGTTKRFPLSVLIAWIKSHIGLTAADVGAQPTITASGILKGDGQGGVGAAVAGTDYQAPLTAGTDYATPTQLDAKANQAQLATVETGPNSSKAYAVGEYFCWNGLLYRVKTAITSAGVPFNVGTNCEATTVGEELFSNSYCEELAHSTNTGAWQAVNLSTAISKFKYVYIAATYVSGSTKIDRVCLVVPAAYFKTKTASSNYIGGYAVINANNDLISWGCYYNSDTRASFYTSRSDTQIYLYGCR